MEGFIDKDFIPRIEEVFVVGRSGPIALEVVLDTGFNDQFCLPHKFLGDCDLIFHDTEKYILANGEIVTEDMYRGEIILDQQALPVLMSLTDDDEALLGTRLLKGKIVTLDFVNYRVTENLV